MKPKPIITVKEARKIMGADADKLSDKQLKKLIDALDMIAKLQLGVVPKL